MRPNTTTEWIAELAKAGERQDVARIFELDEVLEDWLMMDDEREALEAIRNFVVDAIGG